MAEANGSRGSGTPLPAEVSADVPPPGRALGALARRANGAHGVDVLGAGSGAASGGNAVVGPVAGSAVGSALEGAGSGVAAGVDPRMVNGQGPGSVEVVHWDGSEPLLTQAPLLERDGELALVRAVVENLCRHARARSGGFPDGLPDGGGTAAGLGAGVGVGVANHTVSKGRHAAPPVPHPTGPVSGELLIVEGLAGYGKTTMLDQVRRIAVEHHCTVLHSRGGEREQARSFSVVKQLFFNLLAGCTGDERAALLGDWYDIIAPALGLCPATAGSTPDPLGVRDALDWLMTGLTRHRGPIVMVVDDVQWADAESLEWLVNFARNLDQLPVLLVVGRRSEESTDVDELLREMSTLDRTRTVHLGTLSPAAVTRVVEVGLGVRGDDVFNARCHEVTDGSPFVLWAMVGELRRRRLAPVGSNASELAAIAAATIGPKLAARLERMGDCTIEVARAIAVLGSDATPVRVAELAGVDVPKVGVIADRLRAAAILVDQDTLGFLHPLIATAVYQWIQPSARSALHARAARLLVQDGRDARSAAVHLLVTEPCGDAWVVEQLRTAADQDKRAGAPDSALRYLQRALREPPQRDDRAAVRYELGRASFVSSPSDAIMHLRAALADDAADRVLRESIVLQLARALGYTDQIQAAVELLDQEAAAANASSTRLRLQVEHFLWAVFWVDDPDYHTRSRRLKNLVVRLEGNNRTERCLLALRAWYGVVRGDPMVQVLASADQAWGPGLTWTDEDWGFEIPSLLALTYMYCDRNDRAEQLFTAGIAELRSHGWRGTHLSYAHSMRSLVRYRQGKLLLAEEDCRIGLRLALRLGPLAPARWYPIGTLIQVLLARGRVREAVRLAEEHEFTEPFPNAVVFPDPRAVSGELRLAAGMPAEAAADLAAAGEKLEGRGVANPAWCPWRVNLAKALSAYDPETAYEQACEALRRAYRFGAPSAMGQALRVTGRLEGGQKGLAKIEDALMWLEHSDARYEYAVTLVEYGILLRREFGDRDAVDPLFEGLTVAVECGADALADAARAELVDMGELPPVVGSGPAGYGPIP
ncbi:ATP-binding protein [Yinghuangia seranimata]|uniref:ATP-binding protein n=1 Tax=Yinghuangia seranimata TaxID=408067 RepID=UPI00248ADC1A|nr:AAA family ATPase [Yinghuangia seranimata]MDI2126057.1 AAA family ATPase [Yinghuangia seranimata]